MAGRCRRSENDVMSGKTDAPMSVEKAMSRVLSAEKDALAQIAACQSRADGTLQFTRKKIRAMVRRTQQRLVRLHAACEERTQQLVSRMEKEAAADSESPPRDHEQDVLQEAVRVVAAELTTPGSSDAR
jgi:ElaB/YqjD/DUF883 family membrane-anchored ribosome-binding protein